jgi:hypothetical protein
MIFVFPARENRPSPPVFEKRTLGREKPGRERVTHGVPAGGIRIIILRRLFFPWVGPVPGRFARGDGLAPSCPPHFCSFRRESKLVARMRGRCAEKASAGKEFPPEIRSCFRKGRRAYRAPGRAPLQRNNPVLRERTACPPSPRNERRLMVFSRNALASGPGNA